jgi:UDP-2-acetamido-3-amino-2,3-dideoxy-glucuronate N-acetyltransferase
MALHLPARPDPLAGWPQTDQDPPRAAGAGKELAFPGVRLGRDVVIHHPELVNLYGCTIGDNCKIATFVEIQRDVVIGRNVKVEAFAFIPTGVTIEDGAFIGPHVCFTNDLYPAAVDEQGRLLTGDDWRVVPTVVRRGACIGANATIVCGVTIGEGALVGAGSVVTRDVPAHALVVGNPARVVLRRSSSRSGQTAAAQAGV